MKEGVCTDCANIPCLCGLVKLELKIEMLKRDNARNDKIPTETELTTTRKKRQREEELVEQQDPLPVGGSSAAQLNTEGVVQQLHQQVVGGGTAAPMRRQDKRATTESRQQKICLHNGRGHMCICLEISFNLV